MSNFQAYVFRGTRCRLQWRLTSHIVKVGPQIQIFEISGSDEGVIDMVWTTASVKVVVGKVYPNAVQTTEHQHLGFRAMMLFYRRLACAGYTRVHRRWRWQPVLQVLRLPSYHWDRTLEVTSCLQARSPSQMKDAGEWLARWQGGRFRMIRVRLQTVT